jgi:hypothetical protein
VQLTGELDPQLSRWLWLVKMVLAIPHYIVLAPLWQASWSPAWWRAPPTSVPDGVELANGPQAASASPSSANALTSWLVPP